MESSEEDQSVSGTMNSFQAKGIPFPEDKGVYWLGIHVKADKRVLRVHDNATVTYTNFGTNQPDSDGAEECIVVSNYFTGKWSDVPCSAQYFTVCEVES
ncbi:neurocan core protein-like [Dreissena polymorpha]|uniref:C-type lectin domain-containing protein n=1 Tax=Dreissena polymorpha TaxID=45954 RepID=A0A9D4G529_DREPO|nr:neurocan core protein-like [Dreissena polymorpha]KAH3810668.1 hypothetical protein DPMN_139063 [Dreissena polymorpha]